MEPLERWEYLTRILRADAEEKSARQELRSRWPSWDPPKYAPEALIPALNEYGAQGWELVRIEPVYVGKHHDIMPISGDLSSKWSNSYLCAFKRRLAD